MENHIKVNATINNTSLDVINHLNLVQRYDWHHNFELDVPLDSFSGDDKFKTAKDNIGKPITIELKAESVSGGSDSDAKTQENYRSGSMIFKGLITSMSLSKSRGNASSILIKGFSPTIAMEDGLASKAYNEKTLGQIINQILSNYSPAISSTVGLSPDPQLGYCVQYNESNYNFIGRMTASFGQWFYYNGEKLIVGNLENAPKTFNLTFGIDLETYHFDLKLAPLKFTAKTYDYNTNAQFEVNSSSVEIGSLKSDEDVKALLPLSEDFFKNSATYRPQEFLKTQSDLKSIMQYKKAGVAGDLVLLTGTSNDFRLKIGSKIKIDTNSADKSSSIADEFIVINVTHFADGVGNYHNNFEAVPKEIQFPPAHKNFVNPICETQPAKVIKNNDKDSMGRVKVQFYWQSDGEATPWIRMISAHAGKTKGFQFIPEIGDEVLVSFENNNPSFPYVVGSLYHGNAKHDDRQDSDNYIKTIRTVSGNEIRFYDKSGEEEISIHNQDSQNEVTLTLKDDGQITIKSKNKIAISGKDITVDAEKTLKITADQITISGKSSVKVETEQKMEFTAMDYKVAANNSVDIEAQAQATIKSGAGITVDGGPMATIKSSATMEVNGGAMTTIKGGMVMIN